MKVKVQTIKQANQTLHRDIGYKLQANAMVLSNDYTQRVVALMKLDGLNPEEDGYVGDGIAEDVNKPINLKDIAKRIVAAIARLLKRLYNKGIEITKNLVNTVVRFFIGSDNSWPASLVQKIKAMIDSVPFFSSQSSDNNCENKKQRVFIARNGAQSEAEATYKLLSYIDYSDDDDDNDDDRRDLARRAAAQQMLQSYMVHTNSEDSKIARYVRILFKILLSLSYVALTTVVSVIVRMITEVKFQNYMRKSGMLDIT